MGAIRAGIRVGLGIVAAVATIAAVCAVLAALLVGGALLFVFLSGVQPGAWHTVGRAIGALSLLALFLVKVSRRNTGDAD